jgi:hypothetical protein
VIPAVNGSTENVDPSIVYTMNYSQFTKKKRNSNPFPKYIISMFSIMDVDHVHIDAYIYCNASFFEILN